MNMPPHWKERLADLLQDLSRQFAHFPWKTTLLTLYERFREDRLGLTASSLTFTTSIALVPFFTVALALFTAFPIFAKVQVTLQDWLIQSLIPDNIAAPGARLFDAVCRQGQQARGRRPGDPAGDGCSR